MWHSGVPGPVAYAGRSCTMDAKTLLIAALAVAVAVLGYLYYENSKHGLVIDTPGVKIEAK
jgi:hypothetical protein